MSPKSKLIVVIIAVLGGILFLVAWILDGDGGADRKYYPMEKSKIVEQSLNKTYGEIIATYGEPWDKGERKYMYGGCYYLLYSDLGINKLGDEKDVYFYFNDDSGESRDEMKCFSIELGTL